MKIKKIVLFGSIYVVLSVSIYLVYKKYFVPPKALPYQTEFATRRTIKRIIDTTGLIEVAEKIKIGSFVAGIVEKLHVSENEVVTKGQLLAVLDTGKDDTDVREAEGYLQRAKADYAYYQNHFVRQKALYESGQLAKDAFEQAERDYLDNKAAVKTAQAQFDRASMAYKHTKIYSPQDGVIIHVGVSEGQRITTDLDATILFEIARDITKMEAYLEIDESDIGQIKNGQQVKFTVDSYPNQQFKTTIKEISYSPKSKAGNLYYEAIVTIDNSKKLFRPGFTANAKISIAKVKNALSITSQAFMVSPRVLEEIARELNYSFNSMEKAVLKQQKKEAEKAVQTVWVVQRNGTPHSFVEKMVTTNVTDDIYYEITSGLTEEDEVIVDVEEPSYMEEVYKKAFRSTF